VILIKESCLSQAKTCDNYRFLCRLKSMFVEDFTPYSRNLHYNVWRWCFKYENSPTYAYNVYERGFLRHPSNHSWSIRRKNKGNGEKGIWIGECESSGYRNMCRCSESDLLVTVANAEWLKEKLKDNLTIIGIYKELGHRTFLTSFGHFQHYTDSYNFLQGYYSII